MKKATKKKIKKYLTIILIGITFILYNLLLFAQAIISMSNGSNLNIEHEK